MKNSTKKWLSLLFVSSLTCVAFAQQEWVKVRKPFDSLNTAIKEEYYVLKNS